MSEVGEIPVSPADVGVTAPPKTPEAASPERPSQQLLRWREGIDEAGRSIRAYEFTTRHGEEVEAIFFSRGEPTSGGDLVEDRVVLPLGSLKDRAGGEKRPQAEKVYAGEPGMDVERELDAGKVTFLVESSPQHLLDFYFYLGGEDKALRDARREAADWRFTPEALGLMDRVIAANIIDSAGSFNEEPSKHEGEALQTLSLMGDTSATEILEQKLGVLRGIDESYQKEREVSRQKWARENTERIEPLKLQDLAAVHLTRFRPYFNSDTGRYEIKSHFDATRGEVPRTTVHFSLNHPAESHMYGSWEGAGYAIIFPLEEGISENGKSAILNTIDTFWDVPVGGTLRLPEGTVLVELAKAGESLYKEAGIDKGLRIVRYNTELSPTTISQLLLEMERTDPDAVYKTNALYYLKQSLRSELFSPLEFKPELSGLDEETKQLWDRVNIAWQNLDLKEFFKDHSTHELVNYFYSLFPEGSVSDENFQEGLDNIRTLLTSEVRNLAVKDVLKKAGFKVQPGGMWAWGGSWDVTYSTYMLGAQLGVDVTAHTNHPTNQVEENSIHYLYPRKEREEEDRKASRRAIFEGIGRAGQNQRRMLHLLGII